jgi:peptide/nickel transport system substrate-binding protein
VWDIKFRKGVRFHNGKELTTEDVVASLTRWSKRMTHGRRLFRNVESVEATGKYTVRLTLKKGSSVLPAYMTQRARCFIYPKEVVEEAGSKGSVKTRIGTGPFEFVEHKPDRYIKMKRFDKYTARTEPQNGYGGKKVAYVDEILFSPVPEPTQRVNWLQAGEVDYSRQLVADAYKRLGADPTIEPIITKSNWIKGVINKKKGPLTNKKLRQAVQAALDMEPIMMNAVGSKKFYRLDPSYVYKGTVWWTDVGKKWYNQGNPEKAKRLMKEAGYKGEKIRWMASKRYAWMYNSAVAAAQQLKDIGFNIDLKVVDWATLVKRRKNPDEWEIYTTGTGIQADPSQSNTLMCKGHGWACFDELEDLFDKMISQSKYEDRYETLKKINTFFYENAVNIKFGDYFKLNARKKYLKGYVNMELPFFWNVWLDK